MKNRALSEVSLLSVLWSVIHGYLGWDEHGCWCLEHAVECLVLWGPVIDSGDAEGRGQLRQQTQS